MKAIIQIDKHKAKYIITACIPIIVKKRFDKGTLEKIS